MRLTRRSDVLSLSLSLSLSLCLSLSLSLSLSVSLSLSLLPSLPPPPFSRPEVSMCGSRDVKIQEPSPPLSLCARRFYESIIAVNDHDTNRGLD